MRQDTEAIVRRLNALNTALTSSTTGLGNKIPYTGANQAINLGAQMLSTGILTVNTTSILTGGISTSSTGGSALVGNATLVAGTITVPTTKAVTGCFIILTHKTSSGTVGTSQDYTITNGVSFTITSNNALDTSTYTWYIINP